VNTPWPHPGDGRRFYLQRRPALRDTDQERAERRIRELGALVETTFDCTECGLRCTEAQQGAVPRCPSCGNHVEITRVRVNQ